MIVSRVLCALTLDGRCVLPLYDLQARAAAEESSEDRMKFLFSLFDQDGDGDISMEEFTAKMKEVCTTLTDSELQAVCRDCDKVSIT